MSFSDFGFDERIIKATDEAGFKDCTEVQERVFKVVLSGKDVCVQSKTGTGKTAAYLISIFQIFLTGDKYKSKKALVLAPTRELAIQIDEEAQTLGKYTGLKSGSFYGGVKYARQESLLREGLNLYIGTPGRLIDFYKSRKINFSEMDIIVIDEADRMFDMGFIRDIQYILRHSKPVSGRLTLLFSATLSIRVKRLSYEWMNQPEEIEVEPEQITVDEVEQYVYHISRRAKINLLLGILKKYNPRSAIIFTNMKVRAEQLARILSGNGYVVEYLNGDLPQNKRLEIISGVKSGSISLLVATDIAARGLHIDDLEMVINYELPEEAANYVHRIGRTARAGKSGVAISLVSEDTVYNLEPIEKKIGMKIKEAEYDDSMLIGDISGPMQAKMKNIQPRGLSGKRPETHRGPQAPRPPRQNEKPGSTAGIKARQATGPLKLSDNHRVKEGNAAGKAVNEKQDSDNFRISRSVPIEERIKIYEKKYGKGFIYKREIAASKPGKNGIRGFLSRLSDIFRK